MLNLYRTLLDEKTRIPVLQIEKTFVYDAERFNNPEAVWRLMEDTVQLSQLAEEYVYMVAFDIRHHVKGMFQVSHGSTSSSYLPIPEILRMLLGSGGTEMAIAHNHPSSDLSPSGEDISVTKRLVEATSLVGVTVSDHLIVGGKTYYSFREQMSELFK